MTKDVSIIHLRDYSQKIHCKNYDSDTIEFEIHMATLLGTPMETAPHIIRKTIISYVVEQLSKTPNILSTYRDNDLNTFYFSVVHDNYTYHQYFYFRDDSLSFTTNIGIEEFKYNPRSDHPKFYYCDPELFPAIDRFICGIKCILSGALGRCL